MDKHKLDEFFRNELESYPQPPYKEGAWIKLSRQLPPGPNYLLWGGLGLLVLLLLSSILLNFYYFSHLNTQQDQLDSLRNEFAQLEQQITHHQDTIYLYQTDSSRFALHTEAPPNPGFSTNSHTPAGSDQSNLTTSPPSSSGNSVPEGPPASHNTSPEENEKILTVADLTEGDPLLTHTEQVDKETLPLSAIPQPMPSSDETPSEADPGKAHSDSGLDTGSQSGNTSVDSLPPSAVAPRQKKQSKFLSETQQYINSRSYGFGLLAEGANFWTDLPTGGIIYGFGVGGELTLASRLSLYVDGRYHFSSYKIEDQLSEISQERLNKYPGIYNPEPPGNLHEIYADAQSLDIALGLRYRFLTRENIHLAILPSINFHTDLSQEFVYEYEGISGEEKRTVPSGNTPWRPGSARLAIQADFPVGRFRPRLSLFFDGDLQPRGVEEIRYYQLGFSFGWWWFSKNYHK